MPPMPCEQTPCCRGCGTAVLKWCSGAGVREEKKREKGSGRLNATWSLYVREQTCSGPRSRKDVPEEAKDRPPRQHSMDSGFTGEEHTLSHSNRGRALEYNNKEDWRTNRRLARGGVWFL
ncbi:hypothetical protein NDU88_002533 [Pleurodeles waltl]|uniref:Uncharacterized protein n=1 Tax=Pleurodeles waltl TaxID=8319 RepID=A0AAV7M473_PLEWA|nr:hypothetical protein NDU88_002533 [Pleurodeles waltl]